MTSSLIQGQQIPAGRTNIRVVLVYKSGGPFSPKHVDRLVKQIKHTTDAADVLCLTDRQNEVICDSEPLRMMYQGSWSKMEIFSLPDTHDTVYVDLSSRVIGNLNHLEFDQFTMMGTNLPPTIHFSSGVMAWRCGQMPSHLWWDFLSKPNQYMNMYRTRRRRGIQDYISSHCGSEPEIFSATQVVTGARPGERSCDGIIAHYPTSTRDI